jgi:hypothetical protein
MLKYVLRIDMLHRVVSSVDVWVAVLERRFKHERSREAVPGSRPMVRAGISALALNVCNVGVLRFC